VTQSGGGKVYIKTTSGRTVVITRKRRAHRHFGYHRANKLDKFMEMALIKSIVGGK